MPPSTAADEDLGSDVALQPDEARWMERFDAVFGAEDAARYRDELRGLNVLSRTNWRRNLRHACYLHLARRLAGRPAAECAAILARDEKADEAAAEMYDGYDVALRMVRATKKHGGDALALEQLAPMLRVPTTITTLRAQLTHLTLSDLDIGDVSDEVFRLDQLTHLWITRCPRITTIRAGLAHLSRLTLLEVSACRVSTIHDAPTATLTDLNLALNRLEALPSWIGRCSSLRRLSVFGDERVADLDACATCPDLVVLDASYSGVRRLAPQIVARLASLSWAGCSLTDDALRGLTFNEELQYLDLSCNRLAQYPLELVHAIRSPQTTTVLLGGNEMTAEAAGDAQHQEAFHRFVMDP